MEGQQQGLASTEDAASSFSTPSLRGEFPETVEERISDHIPGLGTFYLRRDRNSRKRRRDFVNLGRSQRAQIVRNAYAVVESVCDLFCPGERMDLMDAIVAIHPTYRRRYEKRVAQAAAAAAAATNGVGPRGMEMALMATNPQWPAFEYLRAGAAFGPVHVPMMSMDPYAAAAAGRQDMQMLSFRRQQHGALLVNGGMATPLFTPAAPPRDSCTDAMEHLTRLAAGSLAELRSRAGNSCGGAQSSQLQQHTAHMPMSQATMTPQWTGDASFTEALGALGVKSESSSAESESAVESPKVMKSPGVVGGGVEGSGTHAQSAAVAHAPVVPPEALILQKLRASVEQKKERGGGHGPTAAAEAVNVKATASAAGQPYPCGAGRVATE